MRLVASDSSVCAPGSELCRAAEGGGSLVWGKAVACGVCTMGLLPRFLNLAGGSVEEIGNRTERCLMG